MLNAFGLNQYFKNVILMDFTLQFSRSLHESRFRNYFRMTATQFEELLLMVAPQITKKTVIRKPISAEERLSLTLRLLLTIIIDNNYIICMFLFVLNVLINI